ncbi:hypothetical protein CTI12_AA087430 [Artemisia annua]|uniref:Glycine-rich protein n=1 Tax=Artemisia annua TaxID=35608 RepID=A0A2U1PSE7_ARTAN|nr:hypothetical protein CTI12_AA087430 [Artemisia annua]
METKIKIIVMLMVVLLLFSIMMNDIRATSKGGMDVESKKGGRGRGFQGGGGSCRKHKGRGCRHRGHECSGSRNATSDHGNTTQVHGCNHNCGSLHASAMHPLASSILGGLVLLCLG